MNLSPMPLTVLPKNSSCMHGSPQLLPTNWKKPKALIQSPRKQSWHVFTINPAIFTPLPGPSSTRFASIVFVVLSVYFTQTTIPFCSNLNASYIGLVSPFWPCSIYIFTIVQHQPALTNGQVSCRMARRYGCYSTSWNQLGSTNNASLYCQYLVHWFALFMVRYLLAYGWLLSGVKSQWLFLTWYWP